MRAFVVHENDGSLTTGVADVEPTPTDPTDLLIDVDFSGVNYKDALVAVARSRVRRVARVVGGVDAAGIVAVSADPALPVGTRVAVHGGDLGVARDGGFATQVYAPARFVSALPATVSTRDAMVIGTAGFTAMASVLALEERGLAAGARVLVTGATGGVGSMAVAFLAQRGHQVVASTGSAREASWLRDLGAHEVVGRDEVSDKPDRVLGSELWDGAVDCVGGDTLAQILRSLRYGAAVAASGLVAGADLSTTVYPFITRGVALLGIDAVEMRARKRERTWSALGEIAPHVDFRALTDSVTTLEGLGDALDAVRRGATRGRILVDPAATGATP
jgi:acrylyl-CoA reductase (NADPH)